MPTELKTSKYADKQLFHQVETLQQNMHHGQLLQKDDPGVMGNAEGNEGLAVPGLGVAGAGAGGAGLGLGLAAGLGCCVGVGLGAGAGLGLGAGAGLGCGYRVR